MDWTHFHLMTNHIPVIGSIFGMVILAWGALRKSEPVISIGLATLVFTGLIAIPVYLTGEPAEEAVEGLPGVLEQFIESHEDFAKIALISAIVSGVTAFASLLISRVKANGRLASVAVASTVALSAITAGTMGWTARLGGLVRHTEIRSASMQTTPASTDEPRRNAKSDDDDD